MSRRAHHKTIDWKDNMRESSKSKPKPNNSATKIMHKGTTHTIPQWCYLNVHSNHSFAHIYRTLSCNCKENNKQTHQLSDIIAKER